MENPELANAAWWLWFWELIGTISFFGVIVTLAVEFGAARLAAPYKETLDKAREERISAANERAAKAELQLHQVQSVRSLDFTKFKAGLAGVPPQEFEVLYDPGVPDGENLAFLIGATLGQVGWRSTQPMAAMPLSPQNGPPGLESFWHTLPLSRQAGGATWGVSVVTNALLPSPSEKSPVNALMSALSGALIGPQAPTNGGSDFTMPPGIIRIIVGAKLP